MIYTCLTCGNKTDQPGEPCSRCGTSYDTTPLPEGAPVVKHQIFRGVLASWDELCEEAGEFATKVGRENLITISHSEDRNDGVIVVWFWER